MPFLNSEFGKKKGTDMSRDRPLLAAFPPWYDDPTFTIIELAAFAADPALPATPTAAQLRTAILTLRARDIERTTALRDVATGADRNITRTRRLIRLVAALAGIPAP